MFLLILCLGLTHAQPGRKKGLRIGYDLSRTALGYIDTDRKPFEVSADFEVAPRYYATVEYGQELVSKENDLYSYSSTGSFARIGVDINSMQKKLTVDQYEMMYLGLRYGFASYQYQVPNLTITDNYWGGRSVTSSTRVPLGETHWFEVVGGIRGEIFPNFFIGWAFRARLRLHSPDNTIMDPLYIPGYGKGSKRLNMGFSYSIFYRIPMYTVGGRVKKNLEE